MTQTSPGGFVRTEEQAITDTKALRMRSSGMTYGKIAEAMGCSKSAAYERVQRALAAIPAEAVDEYRRLETDRLDTLLELAMRKVESEDKGFLFAIDRVLAIMDRRSKLLGLDSPVKHEVITLDYIQSEIMRLEAVLGESDDNDISEAAPRNPQEA